MDESLLKKDTSINIKELDNIPKTKLIPRYTFNLLVVCLISFSQGISGLPDLAFNYMYKDDFNLPPSTVTSIVSIVLIPWFFKPLYGFISDSFPIMGYRRKPYLLIFTLVTIMTLISLVFLAINIYLAVMIILIYQTSSAFNNVIAEALIVETSRKQSKRDEYAASKNVFIFFFIRSIGYLLTSLCSGVLLEYLDKKYIFVISACFPLLILISAFCLKEKKTLKKIKATQIKKNNLYNLYGFEKQEPTLNKSNNQSITFKNQLLRVWEIAKVESVFKAIIFLFIYSITPSYSLVLFYFYSNELKFTSSEIGIIRMIYGIAVIFGMIIFNFFLKQVRFRNIMITSIIMNILFNLNMIVLVKHFSRSLGISDLIYSIIGESFLNSTNEIMTMPILILVCHLCPKNVEGTLYALFMGIMNLGYFIAGQMSAVLTHAFGVTENNFDLLHYLIMTICCWLVFTILATFIIDEKKYKKPISLNKEKKKRRFSVGLNTVNNEEMSIDKQEDDDCKSENSISLQ